MRADRENARNESVILMGAPERWAGSLARSFPCPGEQDLGIGLICRGCVSPPAATRGLSNKGTASGDRELKIAGIRSLAGLRQVDS